MSAPQKSRWGSLLSQAVAGVEARLDKVLADADEDPKQAPVRTPRTGTPATSASKPSATTPKTANDRLQERLARAVAARNNQSTSGTRTDTAPATPPRGSIDVSSPSQSPRPSIDKAGTLSTASSSNQNSIPSAIKEQVSDARSSTDSRHPPVLTETDAQAAGDDKTSHPDAITPSSLTLANGLEPQTQDATKLSDIVPTNLPQEEAVAVSVATSEKIVASLDLYEQRIKDLEKAIDDAQSQHQEEVHSHVEQIDALQAKLQYLAREAAANAKSAAMAASPGSVEKKLAGRDAQIAELMEEGQKLAGNEQKLRTMIKKLRAQISSDEKGLNEQKLWRQKAEAELAKLRDSSHNADELAKATEDSQRLANQLKKEVDRLKSSVSSKDATISELRTQIQDESDRTKALSAKLSDHVREAGQQRLKELEDAVATLEIEKSLAADRAKAQANELRGKAQRESERAKATELEMKGEIQVLESKLEAVRARAEEASSGAVGDAQAKLLRQIETLQTQYSVASENWQGIEASLMARTANLEKERDEALRRESDMRKKARENVSQCNQLERNQTQVIRS
jgi:TATA element modulatory factor